MPGNFPLEQYIFSFRALPDVVHDQVAVALRRRFCHYNPDMENSAAKVPGNKITWRIISCLFCGGQRFSLAAEEDHQVWHSPMIDVCVRMRSKPSPSPRVGGKVLLHVLVNFFLQIDAHRAIGANHFIRAYAGIWRNISTRIRNADVRGVIAHYVVRSLLRSGY